MDTQDGIKQQLIDLSSHLKDIEVVTEQPAPLDWKRMRKQIETYRVFLDTFIIPELPDPEPGYKNGNGHLQATYTPRPKPEELTEAEPQTGTPFLAPVRPGSDA